MQLAGRASEALALLRGDGAQGLNHRGPANLTSLMAAVLGGAARVPGVCTALAAAGVDFAAWLNDDYRPGVYSFFEEGGDLADLLIERLGRRRADAVGKHLWEGATAMLLACQ